MTEGERRIVAVALVLTDVSTGHCLEALPALLRQVTLKPVDPFDALLRDLARSEPRQPSTSVAPEARIAARYTILGVLGKGGTSTVYRARDDAQRCDVAIKIFHVAGHESVRRARREARAMRMLDPTRIARPFDVGETGSGEPYIAMELVVGTTAREMVKRGEIAVPEVLRIAREVGTTLAAAHRLGLVHRDVKPDNVLIQQRGRVVLLDFGIVKRNERHDEGAPSTMSVTAGGLLVGTPAYFSPEQALGEWTGPASDQFSLAVTVFELLTRRLPWAGKSATRILAHILSSSPLASNELNPGVPRAVDVVLSRALAKDARDRFPSTTAFVDALDAAGREVPSAARSITVAPVGARAGVRVKGINFRSFLAALRRLRGDDAVSRTLDLLPLEVNESLRRGTVMTSAWYPIDWYKSLHRAAQRACGEGPALSRAVASDALAADFGSGVHRLVTLTLSPEALSRWAPRVLRSYWDGGRIVIEQAEAGRVMGRFEGFRGFDRNMWEDMIGGAVTVLALAGARDLVPRVLAGGKDDEEHMSYAIRWTA